MVTNIYSLYLSSFIFSWACARQSFIHHLLIQLLHFCPQSIISEQQLLTLGKCKLKPLFCFTASSSSPLIKMPSKCPYFLVSSPALLTCTSPTLLANSWIRKQASSTGPWNTLFPLSKMHLPSIFSWLTPSENRLWLSMSHTSCIPGTGLEDQKEESLGKRHGNGLMVESAKHVSS